MYTHFAPNLTSWIKNVWILWFEKSNRYTIVDSGNYTLIELFFSSKNKADFLDSLIEQKNFDKAKSLAIFKDLKIFITDSNQTKINEIGLLYEFDSQKKLSSKTYSIYGKTIQINFDSEIVMNLLHPSLLHLQVDTSKSVKFTFDIYIEDDLLCLFYNKTFIKVFPKKDYHLLQGKFIMKLLCVLYTNQEEDWLGLFHASTVSNGKEAIMCVGNSGSGKSTLAALLMANGFELVTDDVSPVLSSNNFIHSYPGAISIKKGAFGSLAPLINNFDELPLNFINNSKSSVKYIPPSSNNTSTNYPCKNIVLINYSKDSTTKLEKIGIEDALQILITDSWISPAKHHAQNFLDWLGEISFYRLSYSNSDEAVLEFSSLFE